MDHEQQLIVEFEDEPLADAADAAHGPAEDAVEGRIVRAQDERAREGDALEALADDVARQGLEIDDDVGQLRQIIF
jgi:hypothetical protein